MKFVADLHVHSHFSRATSKNLTLENLAKWAQLKGIAVVGTGDFVHPGWMAELKQKLLPAEEGLFKLKSDFLHRTQHQLPAASNADVRFMPTVEISNIYKRHDKVRKVHNLIFAPHFEAAEKIQARLEQIGNIHADGRPILGLDSHDLLEIALECDPDIIFIPAHIWTPWFSALGSKGGFDSMHDYLGDLLPHVFAVETGLSSDPPMNWRLSQLDPYVLVSNSDAHSPAKLGREATIFDTELSYGAIYNALAKPQNGGVAGTIEFFPQEGKYHYDGHRACKMRLHPNQTSAHDGLCPACKKPVTVGVLSRVEALADRPENSSHKPPHRRPFFSLIPLPEIIADAKKIGAGSKTVQRVYRHLLAKVGNELFILQEAPLEDIEHNADPLIAEGIRRVRNGEVKIDSGYDGEFGRICIFSSTERQHFARQASFFPENPAASPAKTAAPNHPENGGTKTSMQGSTAPPTQTKNAPARTPANRVADVQYVYKAAPAAAAPELLGNHLPENLNAAQWRAVTYAGGHLLIVAGPGTGKTHTLTERIAHIVQCFDPGGDILAITFTNKAAEEMQQRLQPRLKNENIVVTATTFHSFCLHFLRMHSQAGALPENFHIAGVQDIEAALKTCWPDKNASARKQFKEQIATCKAQADFENEPPEVRRFNKHLRAQNLLDFDDLIIETLRMLQNNPAIKNAVRETYPYIFVDEYQYINHAQHALLLALTGEKTTLTAIGDPNQAIYGFRGADPGYFDRFADDFPGAKTMQLADNYRSAQNILSASGQVIAKSAAPDLPALTAKIAATGQLTIHETPTEAAEAEYIVHRIEKLVGGTSLFSQDSGRVRSEKESEVSFGDIAVLYRLNSQRRTLEQAFRRSGIPYQVSGDTPLVAQPGVAQILTALQLAGGMPVAAAQVAALLQFVVEGIGAQTAAALLGDFHNSQNALTFHDLQKLAQKNSTPSKSKAASVQSFLGDIADLRERLEKAGVAATLQHLFVMPGWQTRLAHDERFAGAWQRLTRLALLCSGLREFIDQLHLQRPGDALDARAERVSLMTLHASKGLEFPVVFISGCERDLMPLQIEGYRATESEERRLFYVGMTRAKEQLFLLRAKKRTLFGKTRETAPSPFLHDIAEALKVYDRSRQHRRRPQKIAADQMDLFAMSKLET